MIAHINKLFPNITEVSSVVLTSEDDIESASNLIVGVTKSDIFVGATPITEQQPQTTNNVTNSTRYSEDCADCCHSDLGTFQNYYNIAVAISTDVDFNREAKTLYYDTSPGSKERFTEFFTQEVLIKNSNRIKVLRRKLTGSGPKIPDIINRNSLTIAQFEDMFNFNVPNKAKSISLFTFIELDTQQVNSKFKTNFDSGYRVQSPITMIEIVTNGTKKLSKKRRFVSLENSMLRAGSIDISKAISKGATARNNVVQNQFWVSKNDQKTNTAFFTYNRTQLIQNLSFISSLKNISIYKNAVIDSIQVSKITNNKTQAIKKLLETNEDSNGVVVPKETREITGDNSVVSNIEEADIGIDGLKFLKIDDFTGSLTKFRYQISFTFRDPSIQYLEYELRKLSSLLSSCEKIYTNPNKFKVPKEDASKVDIRACIDTYIGILDNFGVTPEQSREYLNLLSDLDNDNNSHEIFIKIIRTLIQTVDKIIGGTSKTDKIDSSSTNKRSSLKKAKTLITKQFLSELIDNKNNYGYDFWHDEDPKTAFTTEPQKTKYSSLKFTKQQFSDRGANELLKFWDAVPSKEQVDKVDNIVEKAKFNWTPNLIIGGIENINLKKINSYDDTFHKKINASRVATKGKAKPDNTGFIDQFISGMSVTFGTPSAASDALTDTNNYLKQNTNFISNNIETFDREQTELETKEVYRILGVDSQSQIENHFRPRKARSKKKLNFNPDDSNYLLNKRSFESLPPSYQAYLNRKAAKTKFSKDANRYDDLTSTKNSSIVENFMNLVTKTEYLDFNPESVRASKWIELNSEILSKNNILFCRTSHIEDKDLNISKEDLNEDEIYKRYFLIVQK